MAGENGIYLLSMKETKFKHTEIGLIPEDWEVKSLVDATPLQRGFDLPKTEQQIGPYPVVYSNGICSYHNKFMIKGPGVVTGRSGTIGSVHYIESDYWPHNTTLWVTKFNGNYPLYVYYLFQTIDWKLYSTGSGVPTLNRNDVHEKLLPFPTYEEQSRIATALYDIDTLIQDLDRTIEKKKNIRQGAMEQLLSGKKRLPGFKGEWKPVRLNEIFFFGKGKGLKKEELTENGKYKCILYGEIFTQYNYTIKSVVSKTDKYEGTLSKRGDILMPGSTTTTGIDLIKAVSLNEDNVLLGGDVIILRPKDKRFLCSDFMAYLMSVINRKNIADVTQGTTIIHLHTSNMTDILYTIPPTIKEQYAISDMLTAMDDEIAVLQMERDKYANIRSGMMDDLLTGRKRL